MFPEISLNILDVVQNSIGARASLVEITVSIDTTADTLTVIIRDDGRGTVSYTHLTLPTKLEV